MGFRACIQNGYGEMRNPVRLLFCTDTLNAGGKERQLIELLKCLEKNNTYHFGVVVFNEGCFYANEARNLSDYFIEIPKRRRLRSLLLFHRILREFKPDLIHIWDLQSAIYSNLFRLLNVYKIIDGSIRDAGVDKGITYFLKVRLLRRADMVVANSKAGLTYYGVQGQIIFNSIDPGRFHQRKNEGDFILLMIANFTKYKDHGTFIKATLLLMEKNIVDKTWLIGSGPEMQKWMAFINQLNDNLSNRFTIYGRVKDVESFIADADVGIMCSTIDYGEGLSNAILEYMAGGAISIATNIGGTNEIIKDRENGFLIPEKGVDELIEIVKELKNNVELSKKIRREAFRTINQKFNPDKNLEMYLKLYQTLSEI